LPQNAQHQHRQHEHQPFGDPVPPEVITPQFATIDRSTREVRFEGGQQDQRREVTTPPGHADRSHHVQQGQDQHVEHAGYD